MNKNVEQIVDQLKTLTLIEATELIQQIEDTFGVDASAPVGGAMVPMTGADGQSDEPAAEEKTSFDITLEDIDSKKRVPVLKVIRNLTSVGLADAKAFTTSLPKVLKEDMSKEEAEEAKAALEEAGATVSIS